LPHPNLTSYNLLMAELPEILIISRQMDAELSGFELEEMSLGQPKSLDRPAAEFEAALAGRRLKKVRGHGKWIILEFTPPGENLLINPGMGMDLLSLSVEPEGKTQFLFRFTGGRGFSLRFWWLGHLRLAAPGREPIAAGKIGPAPLSPGLTPGYLDLLIKSRPRTGLKSFLLNQKNISGIGNFYAHDICFRLKAHPLTRLKDLSAQQQGGLLAAIEETLGQALGRGINYYEYDFHGRKGEWGPEALLVGYKAGQPCPACGTLIEKIRTGSNAGYICPACQPKGRP